MSKEELLNEFARYLDDVLNKPGPLAVSIQQNTTEPNVLLSHAQQASRLLREYRTETVISAVKSYGESRKLQETTREDYCSIYPEGSFEREALDAFLGFLKFQKAMKATR